MGIDIGPVSLRQRVCLRAHGSAGTVAVDREVGVTTVLFACVHNAGRSQMAAAFFNALANRTRAVALSAGTQPAAAVHPEVMAVMREVGLDLSTAKPTRLTEELVRGVQILVTMGCGEACPFVPGLRRIEWALTDPKGQHLAQVRAIRDEVRGLIVRLLMEEGWAKDPRTVSSA